MEIKIKFPDGACVEIKREPMSWERFQVICWLIGIFIVGSGLIKFFVLSV